MESACLSKPQRVTWLGKLLGYRDEHQAVAEYAQLLAEGQQEDFDDLEQLGFLKVGKVHDKRGRPVVLVAAHLYPAQVVQKERALRYFCTQMDAISQAPYTLVWLHTRATYLQNCPSASFLWASWERLPSRYRTNLSTLHVLHCDLSLWAASLWLAPWWSSSLWHKIQWAARVEFLYDHIVKRELQPLLPAYVLEHDQELEEQPLADYGIVVAHSELVQGAVQQGVPPL